MRAGNAPVNAVMQRLALTAAGLALVIVGIWSIGPDGAPLPAQHVPSREPPSNVLLITIETVAARHCSLYGYERDTTPFLLELAAESVVFDNAWAASSWTRPAMTTVFTGLMPSEHGVNGHLEPVPDSLELMAERYRASGYATGAVWAAYCLGDEKFNFAQGLDHLDYVRYGQAADMLERAWAWIQSVPEPWFLSIHLTTPIHLIGHQSRIRGCIPLVVRTTVPCAVTLYVAAISAQRRG